MSGYRTTLYPVQDALEAALKTHIPTATAQVSLGFPAGGWKSKTICYVGAAWNVEVADELTGFGERHEAITGEVRVMAERTTDDYRKARDAVAAVVELVEDALAADRTLGGAVEFITVASIETKEGVEKNVRFYAATISVSASAYAVTSQGD